jgi:stage II sporulation protein M
MKKKTKKSSENKVVKFLKENYSKCWQFIKDSKKLIYWAILIFFIFSLIGFFIPASEAITNQILELIRQIIERTQNMSAIELTNFIFWNNLKVSFLGMIGGIILGIFPIMELIANGYLLGFVATKTANAEGILSLWRILPHGIFELTAIFISMGIGLRIGFHIFLKKKKRNLKETITEGLRVFLFVVFPLLLLAAIIEGLLVFYLR